jgi:hypothetical protein
MAKKSPKWRNFAQSGHPENLVVLYSKVRLSIGGIRLRLNISNSYKSVWYENKTIIGLLKTI